MNIIAKIFSLIGFCLTIAPSFLVYLGMMDLSTNKLLMLIGTIAWFCSAPFWMNKKEKLETTETSKD